ncbi:hypothetical protein SUGI_0601950 [Cryptomeria japonica]|nr:hypothetical protein SUGI_0601950 [Cryptomeria japonica]
MARNHPYDREISAHNHLWPMVVGKRAARAETREAKVTDQPKMWVIPITSQIPNCTTKANKIPLGSRTNNLGPGQSIRKPQQNMRPFTNRTKGYVRPVKEGGRALPFHGPKFAKSISVSKQGNSPYKVVRNEDSLVVTNLDPDPIKIKYPIEAKDLSKYCRGHSLFARWGGNNQPLEEIVEWWKTKFHGQVSITTLVNNFIYIECHDKSMKAKLLHEDYVFYKGINFNFIDWQPKFDANSFEIEMESKWIEIHNVPIELMHAKILIEIGDSLGKFIAVEKNWSNSSDIKMLIEFNKAKRDLKNIILETIDGIYTLKPVWYNGPITEDLAFCKRSNHNLQKPQATVLDKIVASNEILDIQFNDNRGGFIINIGQQRIETTPTPPPIPVLGNSHDRTLETRVHNNEEQIQAELNNVIENLMGKIVEEYVDEILIDTPSNLAENDIIPIIE